MCVSITQFAWRELIVLQGAAPALYAVATQLASQLPGDWVTLSDHVTTTLTVSPRQAKSLLGREFQHAIFDATDGFNLDALLMLAGTLKKGSRLLLLLPADLLTQLDSDSLRWNEADKPIATPHFRQHLQATLRQHRMVCYAVNQANVSARVTQLMRRIKPVPTFEPLGHAAMSAEGHTLQRENSMPNGSHRQTLATQWLAPTAAPCSPTPEQQAILNQLIALTATPAVLLAQRGRGKSALAGLFTWHANCWVCAPNRESVTTLSRFAKPDTPFFAPDHLLLQWQSSSQRPDWLIIDEAAMIPLPLLQTLVDLTSRTLIITTTDGYEGTGQGFLLKLLPMLSDYRQFTLQSPIRWLAGDPLEAWVDDLMHAHCAAVLDPALKSSQVPTEPLTMMRLTQSDFTAQPARFSALYSLLKKAHYRTTPVDLRRLYDAQNLVMTTAQFAEQIAGACLAIKEGSLDSDLAYQVWLGQRRPKGNLVAQSLAAHAGEIIAATLSSLRINRITVADPFRRQGIGKQLLDYQLAVAKQIGCDYVSVSFGYEPAIGAFWRACGFTLVHIGSHREASSGCYAAMAIRPLTAQGQALTVRLSNQLARNWCWLQHNVDLELTLNDSADQVLNSSDWQVLGGFAFAHRPYEASYPAICRLKQTLPNLVNDLPASAVNSLYLLTDHRDTSQSMDRGGLTGRHQFISALRLQVKQLLIHKGMTLPTALDLINV